MRFFVFVFCLLLGAVLASPAREYEIEKRIAGGDAARPAQFPFQVGISTTKATKEGMQYNSWCGGSLISDEWVLTAAHCLQGGIQSQIYLGTTDLDKEEPGRIVLTVPKENLFVYENYIPRYHRNDIALAKLPRRVPLNEYIQTVNLPKRNQLSESFIKQVGWISGWGLTSDDGGTPKELQYTRRWILPHEYCDYEYGGFYVKETQVCIDGSHGMGSCRGDSGGPLTVEEEDGTRTLVGATSYGRGTCGRDNRLTVWKFITRARQDFWRRWHLEYLSELQKRQKWFAGESDVKEGTVVVFIDKLTPCMKWPLGIVLEVYPGSDGISRVVKVKTSRGIYMRNATSLCPLPVET